MLRKGLIRLIAPGVILFWMVMTAFLVQRELLMERAPLDARAAQTPTDAWMGVYLPGDVQVGFLNVRTTPSLREGREGTRTQMSAQLGLNLLGTEVDLTLLGSAWTSMDRGLETFDMRLRSGDYDTRVEGVVVDDRLDLNVETAGETVPLSFPLQGGLRIWGGSGLSSMSLPPMNPGDGYTIDAFDPLTLSTAPARLRCTGREVIEVSGERVEASVVTVESSGMTNRAWIAPDGEVLQLESPMGLTLRRVTPQEAIVGRSGAASSDLLGITAVAPEGLRPKNGARRMALRLGGIEPDVTVPTDATQTSPDGRDLVITSPSAAEALQAPSTPEDAEALAPYLGGDAFIQTEHEIVRTTAAEIVGEITDPWPRAMAIYEWVYANIEKESTVSIPSALEVLQNRRGDCNEHTILFTALARAVGIPTRVALGVVWSDRLDGFYYHAWPEVHVGRWIWMDPTLGQPIADATHVKLLTGGIDKWPELISFLGRLQIEVTELE